MAAHHAPRSPVLSGPYASVAIGPAHDLATYFDLEPGTKCRHRDIRPHPPDAKLLRLVRSEAHHAGTMGVEILRLCAELTVRTGEEQLVGDEEIEDVNVRGELRCPDLRLERDDLGIRGATNRCLHHR